MLKCEHISYGIGKKKILNDINFTLKPQKHALIIGPSGCGKTTLLAVLAGLQKPDKGKVCFDDTNLYALTGNEIDHFRGMHIGIIFQTFHLIKVLTVRQNLLLAQSLPGKHPDEKRVDVVLKRLGLLEKAEQAAGSLSVGEAQRLAVARAVVGNPQWIFCDEPTSALDDTNAKAMLELLEEEAEACKATLLVVTHDTRVKEHFKNQQIIELGGAS